MLMAKRLGISWEQMLTKEYSFVSGAAVILADIFSLEDDDE